MSVILISAGRLLIGYFPNNQPKSSFNTHYVFFYKLVMMLALILKTGDQNTKLNKKKKKKVFSLTVL